MIEASNPSAMVLSINHGEYQRYLINSSGSYTMKNIVTPNSEDITEIYETELYKYCEFTYSGGKTGTSMFSASFNYNQSYDK